VQRRTIEHGNNTCCAGCATVRNGYCYVDEHGVVVAPESASSGQPPRLSAMPLLR
jgi:hypothetical protein